MPRPRALDESKIREVCALVSAGCNVDVAANYVGCTSITIRREARRNAAFKQQLRTAQINSRVLPLQALRQAARTHWRAAAWFLERVHPDEFARRVPNSVSEAEMNDWLARWFEILDEEVTDVEVRNRLMERFGQMVDSVVQREQASRDPAPVRRKRRRKPKASPEASPVASPPQDHTVQPPVGPMPAQTNLQPSDLHSTRTPQDQNGVS